MANENDAKRDMKLTAALVGGALVVVLAVPITFGTGWLGLSRRNRR